MLQVPVLYSSPSWVQAKMMWSVSQVCELLIRIKKQQNLYSWWPFLIFKARFFFCVCVFFGVEARVFLFEPQVEIRDFAPRFIHYDPWLYKNHKNAGDPMCVSRLSPRGSDFSTFSAHTAGTTFEGAGIRWVILGLLIMGAMIGEFEEISQKRKFGNCLGESRGRNSWNME